MSFILQPGAAEVVGGRDIPAKNNRVEAFLHQLGDMVAEDLSFGIASLACKLLGLPDERSELPILGSSGWLNVIVQKRVGSAIKYACLDVVFGNISSSPARVRSA